MTTAVITVTPETLVSEVAELLYTRHITGAPVVNEYGRVVGTVTERELFTGKGQVYLPMYLKIIRDTNFSGKEKKTLPYAAGQVSRLTVRQVMSTRLVFAHPDTTLEQLSEIILMQQINPVPVTDNQNRLIGIVSRSDILKVLVPGYRARMAYRENVPEGERPVDSMVSFVDRDITSRFTFVSKMRANIWLTTAVVLFIVGLLLGISLVVSPESANQVIGL